MKTPAVASETKLTVAIFLVAVVFLMVLAGGPSEFMLAIERTLESVAAGLYRVYQSARA
jgi:hypothetical protein